MVSERDVTDQPAPTDLATSENKPPPDAEAVESVRAWIIAGAPVFELLQSIATHYENQNAEDLITAAGNQIKSAGQSDKDDVRGWCTMACQEIYRRTLAIGDFNAALAAVKVIDNIHRR